MQLKQMTLEADMELLKKECEAEGATAELSVMEEEILNPSRLASESDFGSRTKRYVDD